jgi:N-dimethylarginine dimethylaminohydrolase
VGRRTLDVTTPAEQEHAMAVTVGGLTDQVDGLTAAPTVTEPARRVPRPRRYLMCEPRYFAVRYAINPWMDPTLPVDRGLAVRQWHDLADTYRRLGHRVTTIEPVEALPDMVFAANGATVAGGRVYGARFRYPQRSAEAAVYLDWFRRAGYAVHEAEQVNEGEGDLLVAGRRLLAGTGFRTTRAAHAEAARVLRLPVVTLELVDPRYYHLDTALCVLGGTDSTDIAYFPAAFSSRSRDVLRALFPAALLADEADAAVLGLNAVSDGLHVVLPSQARGLAEQLRARGYRPIPVDISELRKAGGGPKCCTLVLRP